MPAPRALTAELQGLCTDGPKGNYHQQGVKLAGFTERKEMCNLLNQAEDTLFLPSDRSARYGVPSISEVMRVKQICLRGLS